MKTSKWIYVIALASLSWVACDDDNDNVLDRPNLSDADETFVETAAQSNMAQIKFGQLVVTKTTDSLVRSFAQQMVTDHTTAQGELEDIENDYAGIDWPNDLSEANDDIMQQLEDAEGYSFDSLYMSKQVAMHEDATAVYETSSMNATNGRVKAYAAKYLPTLQMHLEKADSIHTALVNEATTEGTGTNDGTEGMGTNDGTTAGDGTTDGTSSGGTN